MSEEMEQEQQSVDDLRSAAFADDTADREVVVFKGRRYEVRAPTVEQQKSATLASQKPVLGPDKKPLKQNGRVVTEVDSWEQGLRLLIHCVYNPDDGKPVFTRHDLDALMKRSAGKSSLLVALTNALKRVSSIEEEGVENAAGNSEGDPTSTPSSP